MLGVSLETAVYIDSECFLEHVSLDRMLRRIGLNNEGPIGCGGSVNPSAELYVCQSFAAARTSA